MNHITQKTLRRMAYFSAIAQAGSIRGGARELGLSVPVLSAALAEFEEELGFSLATRSTRSFQLTSAGQAVYERTQRMLMEVDSVLELSAVERHLTGHLGITLPVEFTASWLPERLARFRAKHPDVTVSVDARDEVVELRDSDIDIAVRASFLPIATKPVSEEYLRLTCVAASQPSFSENKDSVQVNAPMLINPGGRDWIGASDNQSNIYRTLPSISTLKVSNRLSSLVLASHGIGFALVIESAARDYLDAGLLVRLFEDWNFGSLSITYHFRDELPSAEARAFISVLEELHVDGLANEEQLRNLSLPNYSVISFSYSSFSRYTFSGKWLKCSSKKSINILTFGVSTLVFGYNNHSAD